MQLKLHPNRVIKISSLCVFLFLCSFGPVRLCYLCCVYLCEFAPVCPCCVYLCCVYLCCVCLCCVCLCVYLCCVCVCVCDGASAEVRCSWRPQNGRVQCRHRLKESICGEIGMGGDVGGEKQWMHVSGEGSRKNMKRESEDG